MKNVIKREQCKLACGLPNVNILSKVSKFKVLLYLKKSGLDKQGKASIMGRITLNNSMAQFSCKLSCNPKLWNSRSGRLEGKRPLDALLAKNYNQTLKELKSHFSERRTMALVCKLEKYMMLLVQIIHKVVEQTDKYKNTVK